LTAVRQNAARIPPFTLIPTAATGADRLLCARKWVEHFAVPEQQVFRDHAALRAGRLRVGYLSSDFHDHATAYLIAELIERVAADAGGVRFDVRDLMVVHPVRTPGDSPVIAALEHSIHHVLGRRAELIASPGTYDHKHVARIAGVPHCVAYGPGELELAHQPDEYCRIDDIINATKVLALAALDLMGAGR